MHLTRFRLLSVVPEQAPPQQLQLGWEGFINRRSLVLSPELKQPAALKDLRKITNPRSHERRRETETKRKREFTYKGRKRHSESVRETNREVDAEPPVRAWQEARSCPFPTRIPDSPTPTQPSPLPTADHSCHKLGLTLDEKQS